MEVCCNEELERGTTSLVLAEVEGEVVEEFVVVDDD